MGVWLTLVLSLILLTDSALAESLYPDTSDVLSLCGETQFHGAVFGSGTVWQVEFYQSSCGHCRQFAPTFNAHATDVKAWKRVARIAAVNCADEVNIALCRVFKVNGVPDVRLFEALHSNVTSTGDAYQGIPLQRKDDKSHSRSSQVLRQRLIDTIRNQRNRPSSWPVLSFKAYDSVEFSYGKTVKFGIVFEKNASYLAAELKLDLMACPSVQVHRVTSRQVIKGHSVHALPSLLVWNGEQKSLLSNCSRDTARDLLLSLCGQVHRGVDKDSGKEDIKPLRPPPAPGVYMSDLVSALAFAVHREIALHPVIHGSSLHALVQFLQAVHYCMPAPPAVRKYVVGLLRQLKMSRPGSPVSSVTWARMKAMQTSDSSLPHNIHWVGCAGSSPSLRGYPCGLWTLFHTMTTQCALVGDGEPVEDLASDKRTLTRRKVAGVNGRWALLAIHNYIEHFFGCTDCRSHFLSMSQKLHSEVVSNHDAIMWLWEKHNTVNKRLAGASTVDPAHPKIQFPPVSLCPDCRVANAGDDGQMPKWDNDAVLAFLFRFYGPRGIRWSDSDKTWPHPHVSHDKVVLDASILQDSSAIPNSVYYVFFCMITWLVVMVYLRPLSWCRRSLSLPKPKAKQHMV